MKHIVQLLIESLNGNIDNFLNITRMSQTQLKRYMSDFLRTHSYHPISNDHDTPSYVYAQGDIPVCLVAHLDTVFDCEPDKHINDDGGMLSSPSGLGADDRAGVFAIMELIRKGLRPDVLLVTDEEYGQQGTKAFVKSPYFNDFKGRTNYILGLDLDGVRRYKIYGDNNAKFKKMLEKSLRYKFKENHGNMSDVVVLRDGFVSDLNKRFDGCGICVANISMCWTGEHTKDETLDFNALLKTIDDIYRLVENNNTIRYNADAKFERIDAVIRATLLKNFDNLSTYRKAHLATRAKYAGLNIDVHSALEDYAESRAFRVIDDMYDGVYDWVFETCVLEGYNSEHSKRKERMASFMGEETGKYRKFLCTSAFLEVIGYFFRTGCADILKTRYKKIEKIIGDASFMCRMLKDDRHDYISKLSTKYFNTLFFVLNAKNWKTEECDTTIKGTDILDDDFLQSLASRLLENCKAETNTTNLYGLTHFVIGSSDFYSHEPLPQCQKFIEFLSDIDYKKYLTDLRMEIALVLSMLGDYDTANRIVRDYVVGQFDGSLICDEDQETLSQKEHTNVIFLIQQHHYAI